MLMYRLFLIAIALSSCSIPDFDRNDIYAFGEIKHYTSLESIEHVVVNIFDGAKKIKSVETDDEGYFEIYLPLENKYKIEFTLREYVSKHLIIDSRNIPEEKGKSGFSIGPMNIKLFERVDGIDFSHFQNPAGKCQYNADLGSLEWDMEYNTNFKREIEPIMFEYKARMTNH